MQDPTSTNDSKENSSASEIKKSDLNGTPLEDTAEIHEVESEEINLDELIHDKKYNIENTSEQPEVIQPKTFKDKFNIFWLKVKKALRNPRVIVLLIIGVVLPVALAVLAVVFGYDAKLFPSKIEGTVYSENTSQPINNAKITIESRFFTKTTQTEFSSNKEGKFVINNLKYGLVNITVEADGYETYKGSVQIKRGSNLVTVRLKQLSFANLQLKLVAPDREYDFSKSQIVIAGVKQSIQEDGLITDNQLDIGAVSISFTSPDFKDFTQDLTLKPGTNDLGEIQLTPAGDLSGVITDFISEKPIESVGLTIGETDVKTDNEGSYTFLDLLPDEELTLKTKLNGYLDKEVKVTIEQGMNDSDLILVPKGKVVYASNRLGNSNIYISNYDGTEEKLISTNSGDSISPTFSPDGNSVYYFSNKDKVLTEQYSSVDYIPYKVNLDGSNPQRLYPAGTIPEYSSFFIRASKFISIDYLEDYKTQLIIHDMNGANPKTLVTSPSKVYIGNPLVSPNGSVVIYTKSSGDNPNVDGIYKINSDGNNEVMLLQGSAYPLEISPDGTKILISDREQNSSNNNLWIFDINTKNKIQITQGSAPNVGAHFSPDGTFISYVSTRDGKSNVYKVNAAGGNEVKLTNDGSITSASWLNNNNYIIFYNKDGLNIIMADGSGKPKLITKNVISQTDYNYYGNYYVQ